MPGCEQPTTITMPSGVLMASDSSCNSSVPGLSETSAIRWISGVISLEIVPCVRFAGHLPRRQSSETQENGQRLAAKADNPGTISRRSSRIEAPSAATSTSSALTGHWTKTVSATSACVEEEPAKTLLLAERLQRIDLNRPARRHVTGEHRDCCEQQWCADEQARIVHADPKRVDKHIRQRRNYFCQSDRAQKSKNRSGAHQSRAFAQHQRQHLRSACA